MSASDSDSRPNQIIPLECSEPIWEKIFLVAPLVIVGSKSLRGDYNLAPKHMAMPMGWENYYGFVCTPAHETYSNIVAHRQFTVSFPRPNLILQTSLAASPRTSDDGKPGLTGIDTFAATKVDGILVYGCYLYLECELSRIVNGIGSNSLVVGEIVAASVDSVAMRDQDRDDADLIYRDPLLSYLHPGRIAEIRETGSFPFHRGFST